MKKSIFILIMLMIPVSLACQLTTDSFASQVLLNKPGINLDLSKFGSFKNVNFDGTSYIMQSVYNNNLAAIITKENSCKDCISVKIQVPIITKTYKIPYIEFSSSFLGDSILLDKELSYYNGWTINKYPSNLEFMKDNKKIKATFSKNNYELIFELNKEYPICETCEGKCLYSKYQDICISALDINDIYSVLLYSGITNNKESIFYNYKVLGIGDKTITELAPETIENIDFKSAMEQELDWLNLQGIISLEENDILEISSLIYQGSSGNQKIVYSQDASKWDYYYNLKESIIDREISCKEFQFSKIPQSSPAKITGSVISSPYYLVPIATSVFLIILLIILITTARAIYNKGKCEVKEDKKK